MSKQINYVKTVKSEIPKIKSKTSKNLDIFKNVDTVSKNVKKCQKNKLFKKIKTTCQECQIIKNTKITSKQKKNNFQNVILRNF